VLLTRLEEERKASQEKITLLNNAEGKLADAFKALSADALRNNNQSFLDLPKQNPRLFNKPRKASSSGGKTLSTI
jgi:DNA recombination protein RmuC